MSHLRLKVWGPYIIVHFLTKNNRLNCFFFVSSRRFKKYYVVVSLFFFSFWTVNVIRAASSPCQKRAYVLRKNYTYTHSGITLTEQIATNEYSTKKKYRIDVYAIPLTSISLMWFWIWAVERWIGSENEFYRINFENCVWPPLKWLLCWIKNQNQLQIAHTISANCFS